MENSMWRSRARVVAYVDLVLTTLSLLCVILVLFVMGTGTAAFIVGKDKEEMTQHDKDAMTVVMWGGWLLLVVCAAMTAVQMWASLKLLNASEVGKVAYEALDNARIWRNVSIVFLVLGSVIYVVSGLYIMAVVGILWRGLLLFIVYNFTKGLERIVVGTPSGEGALSGLNDTPTVFVKL